MMNRGAANSEYFIPMDLIPEILSRLPAKSIARFRCVSKPWKSIVRTMSIANRRLIIGVYKYGKWSFFSCLRPYNHYGKSSVVVVADFHSKFSGGYDYYFSYVSGLFYFPDRWISKEYQNVTSNPITGQYAILPSDMRITRYRYRYGHLCYDPIGKQFKVLVLNERNNGFDDESMYHILTLGTRILRWREIKYPSIVYGPQSNNSHGICINGVLYYTSQCKIHCFDVRSEKFKILNACGQNLINYKGKLCRSSLEYGRDGGFPLKLRMWVLEDAEKEEWSAYAYTLTAENEVVKVDKDLSVVGVTASGEIVLAKDNANKPFYVFYFNPDTNAFLSVEIQGVREEEEGSHYHRVYCFVDHAEDLNFDFMEIRRSTFESVNKFDVLSLSEDD